MTYRLDAIRKAAGEILQRHLAAGVALPGGFVGDPPPPAPSSAQSARIWAERALRADDPDKAKVRLDRAIAFDRQDALNRLAEAEAKARAARSAGGKARAARRVDLGPLIAQEALRARERRQKPFASARATAGAIVERVNDALGDTIQADTIRRKVPERVGSTRIFGSD
ncbi:hypothetical protein [Paracoccus sp. PAR01]|uniref:hypothetical protein n=1 Tax=Paracoccus sp. PAR01 TaxID=2769282 RepID=UPI00177B89EB|nr:hypothetical protein [Paracoccus sp. PAR01]MBD9526205.1 hypothetical protein [Paracoccus sp. PAR01]